MVGHRGGPMGLTRHTRNQLQGRLPCISRVSEVWLESGECGEYRDFKLESSTCDGATNV